MAFTSIPGVASASWFTDLLKGGTSGAEASISKEETSTHNSQNMPLLDTFINPDAKNITDEDVVIIQDDSFIYNNGPVGTDVSYEKSTISDKMYVYTV